MMKSTWRAPKAIRRSRSCSGKRPSEKIHKDVCAIPLFELLQVWAHSKRVDFGYELKGAMNLAPPITEKTTLAPR